MKKLMISCMALLSTLGVSAQGAGIAEHFGVGVGIGTTGVTIDASTMITDYVGVRVGADIFPSFKLNTELDLDFSDISENAFVTNKYGQLPKNIEVQGKTSLGAGHLLVDLHPFPLKSSFRVTVGAYIGSGDIVSVYNKEDGLLSAITRFNNDVDNNLLPNNVEKIGVELGDYFLAPDEKGNVKASIRVNSFRPYLGIGFGRAVPRNRIGCQFDLGVQFWGSPAIYTQDHKLTEQDLNGDDGGMIKILSKVSVYPALTLRLVGRIL